MEGRERHQQNPIVRLVAVQGEGKSTDELAREARAELATVAGKHFRSLYGSGHPLLPFLAVILSECGVAAAVTVALVPVAPV